MTRTGNRTQEKTLFILSDIHYAGEAEKARGHTGQKVIRNPFVWCLAKMYWHFFWQRNHFIHNHWLDRFTQCKDEPDHVVAVGDYSCDTGFIGVGDDASFVSARECLDKLRARYGSRFLPVFGDHELGKMSLFGGCGGPRLISWKRALNELELKPFWMESSGCYRLIGVVSTLLALPVFEPEMLKEELPEWYRLRDEHVAVIREAFRQLDPNHKVILFCHDPTALPFLWRESAVREKIGQIELTVLGHLHTDIVLWESRMLAGMPEIKFLGNSIRRMSAALREARYWRPFKPRLCPALAGIEFRRRSGFYEVRLDLGGITPPRFAWRSLRR